MDENLKLKRAITNLMSENKRLKFRNSELRKAVEFCEKRIGFLGDKLIENGIKITE